MKSLAEDWSIESIRDSSAGDDGGESTAVGMTVRILLIYEYVLGSWVMVSVCSLFLVLPNRDVTFSLSGSLFFPGRSGLPTWGA